MAMNKNDLADAILARYDEYKGDPTDKDFLDMMAEGMDIYFQANMQFSTTQVLGTIASGTLDFDWKDTAYEMALEIATKTATYFSIMIVPGTPIAGTIISVTNTALTIIPGLTSDILSIPQAIDFGDNYRTFAERVLNHVTSIIWTVTEQVGAVPVTYTVTIS